MKPDEIARAPMEHEIKCWPEYYDAVVCGDKPFEIRKWDRPYSVGDTLLLRRYDPRNHDYTGQQTRRKITYLLDMTYLPGDNIPHYAGYVVLGLAPSNEPLTLDELRGMDGEPVWTVTRGLESSGRWELVEFLKGHYKGREVITMCNLADGQYDAFADTYGQTWLAYRRPPERSEDNA